VLLGRTTETAVLTRLLDEATNGHGGALVLRGAAGVGKTALLDHTAGQARSRGIRVLGTSGVQAEVHIPYAGLHRLARGGDAPMPALATVLDAADTQPYRAAMVLLDLLGAADEPTLVAVEDAGWLDPASWEALTFTARRLGADRVAMVLTTRDGEDVDRRLTVAGLPELRLEPLPAADSGALLDRVAPGLVTALRERVLAESMGNPLGLVELGTTAARSGAAALLPARLPLSTRVERIFTALVGELPVPTRSLLLVAALDDGDDLAEVLAAANLVERQPVGPADVEPAAAAGLVSVDDRQRLRFRHPLLRSALRQSASLAQRRRVHAGLAGVVSDDPRRQVWHRAAAAERPDEALAAQLTEAAARAGQHQAVGVALAALEKAVQLSEDPRERGRRLLSAAQVTAEQGDVEGARRLLAEVVVEQLRPADQAWLSYLHEQYAVTGWSGNTRLDVYAELIDTLNSDGDARRALDGLIAMSLRFYWSNPQPRTVQLYLTVADRLDVAKDDPGLIATVAMIAPIERGAASLERMTEVQSRFDLSPAELQLLGLAAGGIGALDMSARFYAAAVAGVRAQGRIGTLAQLLTSQAFTAASLGDTRVAGPAAAEAAALARETDQRMWALTARLMLGYADALRGDTGSARESAEAGETVLLPGGMLPMLALVQTIRGVAALADGRPEDAYRELHRIYDPEDLSYHAFLRFVVFGHLAEAAVWSGATAELRELAARLSPVAAECGSPALTVALGFATAVLADDDAGYRAALAADLSGWPFQRARLQHAYGGWLRRRRRIAESRPLLRAAAATFDALGASPWAERARGELRASGESLRRPIDAGAVLTPQELQIARLAADGLSNRDIAERLFLSPRTVTTHLYRIYPKVGVASRGELARVLTETPTP